jgi:hypothetical protein
VIRVLTFVLMAVAWVLFLPFYPLFFLHCRLIAKPCPKCGEKWATELTGEWDGDEDWHCANCDYCWGVPYS